KARELPVRKSWKSESEGPLQRESAKLADGRVDSSWTLPRATLRFPEENLAISFRTSARYQIDTGDPCGLHCTMDHVIEIRREDGTARIRSSLVSKSGCGGLEFESTLSVHWDREVVAEKVWRYVYPPPLSDTDLSR
ncbi:MAG: hypothetical protein OXI10_15170, partial [Gammaproteobacteria bacterium]|nr:hypothetical protein [Gammaproteobacteria bacterium]